MIGVDPNPYPLPAWTTVTEADKLVAAMKEIAAAINAGSKDAAAKSASDFVQDSQNTFAAKKYGLTPGELYAQWVWGHRANEDELEDAICDALGCGGVAAFPGEGTARVANMIRYWKHLAEVLQKTIASQPDANIEASKKRIAIALIRDLYGAGLAMNKALDALEREREEFDRPLQAAHEFLEKL
jgi:hypothetical protein